VGIGDRLRYRPRQPPTKNSSKPKPKSSTKNGGWTKIGHGSGHLPFCSTVLGAGENPGATRHEIRLACARHSVDEAAWDDLLNKFTRRFFYLYFNEAQYQFRKEPTSPACTTLTGDLSDTGEVAAHLNKVVQEKGLGHNSPQHGFNEVYFLPARPVDRDDEGAETGRFGF